MVQADSIRAFAHLKDLALHDLGFAVVSAFELVLDLLKSEWVLLVLLETLLNCWRCALVALKLDLEADWGR